jgi:hypothetical protein
MFLMPIKNRTLLATLCFAWLPSLQAAAEPPAARPAKAVPAATAPAAPVDVPSELTADPYPIPSLGMSIYLPADSLVDLSRLEGGRTTILVRPETKATPWVIQIHSSISSNKALTIGEALDNIIEQRRATRVGKDAKGRESSLVRAFDRQGDLLLAGNAAERVYLDVPIDADAPVSGYTLFQNGPGQFVILQLDCSAAVFPRIRPVYEMMAATVSFRDAEELGADRSTALLAGQALLKQLSLDDLSSATDEQPLFYRLSRPLQNGETEEVGYQRVQIRPGKPDELDRRQRDKEPEKQDSKKKKPSKEAEESGTIVRVEARALTLAAVVDTISTFYLSSDGVQELWSITMIVRRGKDREEWNETGIRRADRLTIKTAQTGSEPTSADYALPEGYISRVQTYLLPRLVAGAKTGGLFGFYSYESSLSKMSLRREEFAQDEAGIWTQSTMLTENSRPIVTTLDKAGRIIKRLLPDGQVMEPIDRETLREIWAAKKLPLD